MKRAEFLDQVKEIICHDRQDTHGNAEDNFSRIAEMWSKYIECDLDSVDVARMMMMFKLARMEANPEHLDNYVDLVGYAAIAVELMGEEEQ